MKLFETTLSDEAVEKISEVLKSGDLGFGPNVPVFEERFAEFSKKKYNTSVNSASAAAFVIFAYFKELYGVCDVYTTSLGFTSPVWAAHHFGHNIVFIDVQADLQFCTEHYKLMRKNSFNQPVVMPVLYGGVSNINNFKLIGDEIVVVDSAHCATPMIQSDFVFFSFHPYKPICTSDGGMISTNDAEADQYFRAYRNFGRSQRGLSYDITQQGFKFYMNNLNATIGLTQLEEYHKNVYKRKQQFSKLSEYYELLPHDEHSSYYFATTLVDNADELIEKYRLPRHYPMLHKTEFYNFYRSLRVLEGLHSKILNLPLGVDWSPE